MNKLDAAKFLTVSASLTGREPSEEQAQAWSIVLDDIPLAEAFDALRSHYRESRFPVMPADILDHVTQARARAEQDERRALTVKRKRAANDQHREQLRAGGRDLRDDDVVWPDVGWTDDSTPRIA